MELNADFSKPVVIRPDDNSWKPSPMPGVDRMMLDRLGDEVARATTIVRYASGSKFSAHVHDGGEEFFVLDGVFEDEHGAFPAGSYIRNPPGSSHTPGSEKGCVIFVKLWQFDPLDRSHVRIDTNKLGRVPDASRPGVSISPLFEDRREKVVMETWEPRTHSVVSAQQGAEILVTSGTITFDDVLLPQWSWIRIPAGEAVTLTSGDDPVRLWIKRDHLTDVRAPGR
ncbi:cupin [Roseibium denhamense]|uniref:Anti-ECFsigma factor, ChrR n=1 Tax=Roseibium denhamense TaxID=76305 RepID=A0ABY1NIG3_9HYPH|nr:cupin domain-containing protein [Roseibium denhamense]MTI06701.1 cupin [Roseibium denhamense]SMP10420.1 anti-ECFsigma factor, ChrR [Roseibium denhamense]